MDRAKALGKLSFGVVDAESLNDLDQRFLRTAAFDRLVSGFDQQGYGEVAVVRGAKGTGKSALFELLTRFDASAKRLAQGKLDDVLLVAGSGFLDLEEVATDDIEALKSERNYDHDRLWRLYIGLKVALVLRPHASLSRGPVRELLKAMGELRDRRLLPLLQTAWRHLISPAVPENVTIGLMTAAIRVITRRRRIDVNDLLNDAEQILEKSGQTAWVLFDKIDELYARDRSERRRAIEGLMSTMMSLRRTFPRIRITVFVRSDIWSDLAFTNKSHLLDKMVDLKWGHNEIARLLVKAAAARPEVAEYIQDSVPEFVAADVDGLPNGVVERSLAVILPRQIRYRTQTSATLRWFVHRIRDGNGTYPREAILWANRAAEMEQGSVANGRVTALVSGQSLVNTYAGLSTSRCESYLTEFPDLEEHFARFQGQEGPQFTRAQLTKLMAGLSPSQVEMLRALDEVGVVTPMNGNVAVARSFEVPMLYRRGLGLTTPDWI